MPPRSTELSSNAQVRGGRWDQVLLVVAAAIVIPTVEAGTKAPSGLTAAAAASTVRQFVDQAVVQGDGYIGCARC
jgi:hypothetical protein